MTDAFERLKAALADRYTLERVLGEGGMVIVYLAEDLKLHLASGGQRRLHTTLTQTSSPLRALGRGLPYVVRNLIIENLSRTVVLSRSGGTPNDVG